MWVGIVDHDMHARFPSVRKPRSFYDVFGVVACGIVVMAAVLAVWHGTLVRREMVAFMAIVFLWAVWAVDRVLDHAIEETRHERRR